jgi:hypothetical protein
MSLPSSSDDGLSGWHCISSIAQTTVFTLLGSDGQPGAKVGYMQVVQMHHQKL